MPDRTMPFSFYNHPQLLWVWADRTSLNPRKLSLHVDTRERVNASIKRKERQYRKEGDKPSPEPWSPRKRRIIRARSSINFSEEVQ